MKRLALEPEHVAELEQWGGEPEAEGLWGSCRGSLWYPAPRRWEGIRHPDRQASYKNSSIGHRESGLGRRHRSEA